MLNLYLRITGVSGFTTLARFLGSLIIVVFRLISYDYKTLLNFDMYASPAEAKNNSKLSIITFWLLIHVLKTPSGTDQQV